MSDIIFSNIKNKNVLLRADLNDSIDKNTNELTNTDRIDASITTIRELLDRNNNVILISHLSDSKMSIVPIANYLKKHIENIVFLQTTDLEEIETKTKNLLEENKTGNKKIVILLENLRKITLEKKHAEKLNNEKVVDNIKKQESSKQSPEEENDQEFAKSLASLAEIFVFDAFSVAHRKHASVVSVSKYLPHTLGPIASRELHALEKILKPKLPMTVILGGSKLSTKLPLIERFLKSNAKVFLAGAMAHPILKLQGIDIKKSLTENIELSEYIIKDGKVNNNLHVPIDYIWDKETGSKILDIGDNSMDIIKNEIEKSNTILWNGPLGVYELGYEEATNKIIQTLDQKNNLSNKEKYIVVGGGDTLTVLQKYPEFECSYISLSGGAMLDYLVNGGLPGIQAN